jgi:hypothetical protein
VSSDSRQQAHRINSSLLPVSSGDALGLLFMIAPAISAASRRQACLMLGRMPRSINHKTSAKLAWPTMCSMVAAEPNFAGTHVDQRSTPPAFIGLLFAGTHMT